MKKLWFIIILFVISCDKPKSSVPNKQLGEDEVKLVNPWVDFQTQYNYKNRSKNQEGC